MTIKDIRNFNSDLIGKRVIANFGASGYLKTEVLEVWNWLGHDGILHERIVVAVPETLNRKRRLLGSKVYNTHCVDRDQIFMCNTEELKEELRRDARIMENNFTKSITECPNCKGKVRFFEELGKAAIANGTVGPDFHLAFQSISGAVQDKQKPLHPGDKPVAFVLETDICTECLTIYAVKMARVEAEVKPKLVLPGAPKGNGNMMMNRAQRRHPTRFN